MQVRQVFRGDAARQGIDAGHGLINGLVGILLEFRLAAVGVTAYLEASLLNQFADIDNAVEGQNVIGLE